MVVVETAAGVFVVETAAGVEERTVVASVVVLTVVSVVVLTVVSVVVLTVVSVAVVLTLLKLKTKSLEPCKRDQRLLNIISVIICLFTSLLIYFTVIIAVAGGDIELNSTGVNTALLVGVANNVSNLFSQVCSSTVRNCVQIGRLVRE